MSSFLVGRCPNDMGTDSEIGSSRHVMLTSEDVKVVFPYSLVQTRYIASLPTP